jgi:protein SCO1/2
MVCLADPSRVHAAGAWASRAAGAAAALLVALGTSAADAQLIPTEKPEEIRGLDLKDRLGKRVPLDLVFRDSNGREVKLGDKLGKGRPVVLTMVYLRCPLLCPQLQQRILASLNAIPDFTVGHDYDVIFVSFDFRDAPADAEAAKEVALTQYQRPATETVRQGMSYLTGSAQSSVALGDALGFSFRFLKESGEFAHGTAIYVLTPEGTISQCFTKLDYDPKDLRLALVDASGGKIGTLADLFTLWCYHPTDTGEYVIAPMTFMRIGAALSAIGVGVVVGVWARRDVIRRRRLAAHARSLPVDTPHTSAPPVGALGHSR